MPTVRDAKQTLVQQVLEAEAEVARLDRELLAARADAATAAARVASAGKTWDPELPTMVKGGAVRAALTQAQQRVATLTGEWNAALAALAEARRAAGPLVGR
jgi:hypothetical protein